jgi:hypothetical protein
VNIYYNPEEYGLEIFGEARDSQPFEFNGVVVWRRPEDGAFFYGVANVCSCFSPFHEAKSASDLRELRSIDQISAAFAELGEYSQRGALASYTSLMDRLRGVL